MIQENKILKICNNLDGEATADGKARFVTGKDDFMPHISLSLGYIGKDNLEKIKKLSELDFAKLSLKITDFKYSQNQMETELGLR